MDGRPGSSVGRRLDAIAMRPHLRVPANRQPAVFALLAEIDLEIMYPGRWGAPPARARVSVEGTRRLVSGPVARGAHAGRSPVGAILEAQIADPHRARAAGPGGDHQLDGAELRERPAARRTPREFDLAAARLDGPPLGRELQRVPMTPPHVATARVGELELEAVRGRLATDREAQDVALGHRAQQGLPRDDEAAAPVEVEVETHRGAGRARLRGNVEPGEPGRDRRPA